MRLFTISFIILFATSFHAFATQSNQQCQNEIEQLKHTLTDVYELSHLQVEISAAELCRQTELTNHHTFQEAALLSLDSYLRDHADIESPLQLMIEDAFETLDVPYTEPVPDHVLQYAQTELRSYLDRDSSTLRLISLGQQAEHGESAHSNWILVLRLEDYSDHIFYAVQSRNNQTEVFNYGFN